MNERTIGVIGSGTMGAGIAQVFADAGQSVMLVDLTDAQLDRALSGIAKNLERQVQKGNIPASRREAILAAISPATDYAVLEPCSLVVEAVAETHDIKKQVLRQIESTVGEECIIATNTSTISITELASTLRAPGRFLGMHFMNPAPVIELVEIIAALQTRKEVVATVVKLAKEIGKTPVEVADSPGFVLNRLLIPMINEAICALESGVADAASIDACMKLGAKHLLGPLALADLIGLDVCLRIMEVLHQDFGDPKYRPSPLLRRMVAAGYLGRKAGRGFHTYP